ncbi:hypothetical protein [Flavobacterium sp. N502540]|uniref:hypothetical protein n=1 Tax=Flavobacterium sp. N502540 TaxID=2986838 RepID=UPI0022240AC5|nr:hypothetical protein [Flavobacterium sp. N502540]
MKKLIIAIIILSISCGQKKSSENFCIKKIEYVDQRQKLIPSIVKIQIEDLNGTLKQKVMTGQLKNIILYSIKKNDRKYFYLTSFASGKQFKIIDEKLISLPIITTLFENDLGNKLSNQEIQKKLDGEVGLVFNKDTIIIKKCNH